MARTQWFARRQMGFGVRPVSWQGWTITAVALALVVALVTVVPRSGATTGLVIAVALIYLAIGYLTGGANRAPSGGVAPRKEVSSESPDDADRLSSRSDEATGASPHPGAGLSVAVSPVRSRVVSNPDSAGSDASLTAKNAIEVTDLTKHFGERTAFSDVTFRVQQGEVFGFLGPNGAGKTTMVRALSTLIEPSSGSALVAGIPLKPENGVEIRQRIAVMTEMPGLYAKLSVTENLEFFTGLYGIRDTKSRIQGALEAVNLSARAGDVCGSLSKGLRQRVGLARALLNDPEIIFLDEPTSGLDPVATREVSELIDGLRSRGVTIFLTTHRLEEAERLCDRVAILNTTLRIVGRTDELRQRLFKKSLEVVTAAPLGSPDEVFSSVPGIESWQVGSNGSYVVVTTDPRAVAPELVRALVGVSADVLSVTESHHSLEDVYLQLVDEDVEVRQ